MSLGLVLFEGPRGLRFLMSEGSPLEFRVLGFGSRIQDLELELWGLGRRVCGLGVVVRGQKI